MSPTISGPLSLAVIAEFLRKRRRDLLIDYPNLPVVRLNQKRGRPAKVIYFYQFLEFINTISEVKWTEASLTKELLGAMKAVAARAVKAKHAKDLRRAQKLILPTK